jgi:hypothetical protein
MPGRGLHPVCLNNLVPYLFTLLERKGKMHVVCGV